MPTIQQLFDLSGRAALVTGGAGHLGSAISEALVEAGARVAIASRNVEHCREVASRLARLGPRCLALGLDVSQEPSIIETVEAAAREFGRLDIIVNNAYSGLPHKKVEDMPVEVFESAIRTNATAYFAMVKAAVPHLRRQGKGAVVNIASMYGFICPHFDIYRDSPYFSPIHYHATKGAVIQMTRYMAGYFAKDHIRVNAISPGAFPKPEIRKKDPWFEEELSRQNPMGRVGEPHELKGAALYLASDASSYVTGQNMVVDGGWTVW